MSVRRALVGCVVLSLQDACVFYPCCKACFSRIDVEQDTTRCRCSRCGYSCQSEQVDHRYRLSLRVTRDASIFGVTVFGTCLNPFFGIHANGLQRMMENADGPVGASTRSALLAKAVRDCFIGRHFIFGLKVTGTERRPWLERPGANGSSNKDKVQFIASQMILPKGAGLGGYTVVGYYQVLLQKAAECELGSTDPSKTSRPPETTLLLIPHHAPANSFNNTMFFTSGPLSQSLQRSQHQDSTLIPTPPWQQSLGLITSSAEQEDSCSTQNGGDGSSRQTDYNKTPQHSWTDCLDNHNEESVLSPSPLEYSSYSHRSFAKYPCSSIEKGVGNTSILNSWVKGHNSSKVEAFSTTKLSKTFSSNSLAWEDLPFSESLTEFLCEENKDSDTGCEREPHPNQEEATRRHLEIRSGEKNLLTDPISVCKTQITDSYAQILLDITNAPAQNGGVRHDFTEQACQSPAGCAQGVKARNICSHDEHEEQLEEDSYNCSADLFSSSLVIDMNADTHNVHAETVRKATGASPLLSKPDKQQPRSEEANVPHATPDKLKHHECMNRDSLSRPSTQDLFFIPPSQSTPIVKIAAASRPPVSSYKTLELGEFISQPDSRDSSSVKVSSSLCKINSSNRCCRRSAKENLVCSITPSRHSHRFTPKRSFWKPNKHRHQVLTQQHQRLQKESTGRSDHKPNTCLSDVTVCYNEDDEVIAVPPTPAAQAQCSVKLKRRQLTDNRCNNFRFTEGQQRTGVDCKRTLLDQTRTSAQRGPPQTGGCCDETVDGSLDGSNYCLHEEEEEETCDWSRDLFSDSF